MTTRSAARGPLPGLLLPLPRCPVPGAPGGPVPGLGPARGHPSTDSDGPGVSDPALERMPRSEGHVFTERTSAPLCFQPTARCGDPGVGGAGEALPGPAGLLGAPAWLDQPSLGTHSVPVPACEGASRHPHHTGRGGGVEVWTPALPCRGWFRPAVPWSGWVANLDRLKTSAQVTADGWSRRDERRRAGNCGQEPLNRRSGRHLGCSGGRSGARPHPGLTSAAPTPPVPRGARALCRPAGELQSALQP